MADEKKQRPRRIRRRGAINKSGNGDRKRRVTKIVAGKNGATGYVRSTIEREYDQSQIAKLYLQGKTISAILEIILKGRSYTIGRSTIQADLKVCRKRWLTESVDAINQGKIESLQRLDYLMSEASDAWERSKLDKVKQTQKRTKRGGKDEGEEFTATTEKQAGDPALLAKMIDIVKERNRVLGIGRPDLEPPPVPPDINIIMQFDEADPSRLIEARRSEQDAIDIKAMILNDNAD